MKNNPWIGVVLIAIAVISAVVFAFFKIPEAGIPSAIVAVAIAILSGKNQQDTHQELHELRASMRPHNADDVTLPEMSFPPESDTQKLGRLLVKKDDK